MTTETGEGESVAVEEQNEIEPVSSNLETENQEKSNEEALKCYERKSLSPGHSNFWAICPYVFFVCSVNEFDESVLPLTLELIEKDLNISYSEAQWLGTSYYLGTAATSIPLSKLGEMYGVVKVTMVLLAITFILYLAAFFVHNFLALVFIRAIIGATTSGFLSSRNVFVSAYPSDERREQSVANTLVLRMLQEVIYPSIGGVIVNKLGWEYLHLIPAILILISFCFLIPFSEKKAEKAKFDYFGSITLAILLVSFALCFTFLTFKDWILAGVFGALFIIFTPLFAVIEKKVSNPVLPLGLLKNPVVDVLTCNILNFCNTVSLEFVIPKVLRLFLFSEYIIGVITSCGAAFGVLATFANNFVTKHLVSRILVPITYISVLVSMAFFVGLLDYKYCVLVFYFFYIFFSMGLQEHTYGLLLTCVPRSLASYVSGFPPLSRTFGSSLASCINQGIFEIVSNIKDKEDVKLSTICVELLEMVIVVVNLLISYFRFGNSEEERTKKGFKESEIRVLEFSKENE